LTDDAIASFSRDGATGGLTFVEQDKDGIDGVDGLDSARGWGPPPTEPTSTSQASSMTWWSPSRARGRPRRRRTAPRRRTAGRGAGPPTLDLGAKKQELKKKLKFFATASADSTLVARGTAIKKKTKELAANEKTKVKAKLKRAKRRRLANELEEKGKAKTKIKATATDQSGAEATDKVKVRLKD
jgi:hypothetical protein